MRCVLLVMKRKLLADALEKGLRENPRFRFCAEYAYENALLTADCVAPQIVVLEIPDSGAWTPEKCLALADALRARTPAPRLMVLCPESSPAACAQTVQALRAGRIDDFVYYDTSWQYLVSKLEALC